MKRSFIWFGIFVMASIILSSIVTYRLARSKIIRSNSRLEQRLTARFDEKFDGFTKNYSRQKTMLDHYLNDTAEMQEKTLPTPIAMPQTDQEIAAQRTKDINTAISLFEKERDAHGGSWDVWYNSLSEFHKDMRLVLQKTPPEAVKMGMFPAKDGYIYTQEALNIALRKDTGNFKRDEVPVVSPVAAIIYLSEQFKKRGIDFIYVPIPMNLDIYPEHISENYPPNGIVAPYLRKMFHTLLKADVEVIDLMQIFLQTKKEQPDINLYLEKDIHWSNDAVQIAAKHIAQRIQRYPFVRQAQGKTSLYTTEDVVVKWFGKYISKLENREEYPLNDYAARRVIMPDGEPYTDSEDPQIIILGDSFTYYFHINYGENAGIAAHLSRFTGVPLKQITSSGLRPKELNRRFKEILLPNVQLVLYIQDSRMLGYGGGWELPHFPEDKQAVLTIAE